MKEREKGTTSVEEHADRRGRRQLPLLLLLFLLILVTSSLVGYILGKRTEPLPRGQLIDTILLTPEAEKKESTILHLTGRVLYTDGTPAAGRTLELHSEPLQTMTDSGGAFLFDHVTLGVHSLAVISSDGTKEAERKVVLDRKQMSEGISIDMNEEGSYVVELAMDVRMLEISIELGADNYFINQNNITYGTTNGMVVTPSGTASIHDGPVVTPSGNVCLPDGTIVLSGEKEGDPTVVILPDDTVVHPQEKLLAGDTEILPDGTVILPEGTVIEPGGRIGSPGKEAGNQAADSISKNSEAANETAGSRDLTPGNGTDHFAEESQPDTQEDETWGPGSTAGDNGQGSNSSGGVSRGSGGGGNSSGGKSSGGNRGGG